MSSLIGNKPNQAPSNGDLGTMAFREQEQFLALAGAQTVTGAKTFSVDATISGLTVGKGGGSTTYGTAFGYQALNNASNSGSVLAVGYQAGYSNTTGADNTALGSYRPLYSNTTGSSNIAVGREALISNTTGNSNTAVGYTALSANTTASNNTAVGYQAGYASTTGQITAFGHRVLYSNTTGAGNTGIGGNDGAVGSALLSNTTGNYNIAVGTGSLQNNTTASENTAVGYQAGYAITTGQYNVVIGSTTGDAITTGSENTYVGRGSGTSATTGGQNSFFGQNSGAAVTTGGKNTIIGRYDGNQGGVDIRTSNNNIVLSDGDGNPRAMHYGNEWNFKASNNATAALTWDGYELFPQPDNSIKLGFPAFRWTVVYATTGTINTSDANSKQQIANLTISEQAVAKSIKGLIKTFKLNDSVAEKGELARTHIGVIAQEVALAFQKENLDPAKYALFCSDTWYEVNGALKDADGKFFTKDSIGAEEVTKLGIRYDQLLAFVISTL